jgi:hypothetical protein
MLSAVQFNNQPMLGTAEVGDIISDRHLSPEFDADQSPISEDAPELKLSFGHFPPHAACAIENYWIGWRLLPHHSNYTSPAGRGRASGAGEGARIALDASALTRPTI